MRGGRRRGDSGCGKQLWWFGLKLTIIGLVGLTVGLYAGRPLVTDDAYPVEQGSVEVEAGIELETTTNSYGLTRPVQLRIRGHRLAGTRDQAERALPG